MNEEEKKSTDETTPAAPAVASAAAMASSKASPESAKPDENWFHGLVMATPHLICFHNTLR